MKILCWNVNGVQARLEAINRLVTELGPELMCFQKVRKKGTFLTQIPGYMDWLGIMDDGLFGVVSTYIKAGFQFDFEAQRNDMPVWLMETGCLNVIRFDQFILVNAYSPYVDLSNQQYLKDRQRWNYVVIIFFGRQIFSYSDAKCTNAPEIQDLVKSRWSF